MQIFVTGGTGYIGEVLVAEGKKAGYEMIVLTRSNEKAQHLKNQGVKAIVGDLLKDNHWIGVMNNAEAVIHLAAPPTWGKKVTKKVAEHYAQEHLALTKRLFDVFDSTKVQKLIFVGGTSYFGDSSNKEPKDESYRSEAKGWGPYIAASIDYAKEKASECPLLIVYPAQIYGPSSWMEQLYLAPLYNHKPLTSLKGYDPYFSPIHIEDCGRALLHLIEHGENGEEYILCDDQPVLTTNYRQELIKLMEVDYVKIRQVPRFLCQLIVGPVLTDYATAHTNFSNKKLKETGFTFLYPTYKQGLPEVVKEWLHNTSKTLDGINAK